MPLILDTLRANVSYAFIVVGLAWLAVAVLAGSSLILWPVGVCIVSGVALRMWPGERLTWAWTVSSAVLGFLLSAYQVYAWAPFLGGAFSTLAGGAVVGFAAFAVAHLFLFYAGLRPKSVSAPSAKAA